MKDANCIFCKIVEGTIPSNKVYEDTCVIAFKDLKPHAAKHLLFIHKHHSTDINHMVEIGPSQVQDIFKAIAVYSKNEGMDKNGFRVVTNLGAYAGQTVFHTHFHLLGGELLGGFA